MHHIHINPMKNRMYIVLDEGNKNDITDFVNAIENACGNLAYSFSCVAVFDIKENIRQSDIDLLFNTVDLVYAYGAGRIVLVGKNSGNSNVLQQNLFNLKTWFTVENGRDIQEAENMLDQRHYAVCH